LILAAVVYNLLMVGVVGTALAAVARTRTTKAWTKACAGGGLLAGILAVTVAVFPSPDAFTVLHLAAYGIFVHGVALLVGSAALLWRTRRLAAAASASLAVLTAAIAVDAFLIEPTWLEVSRFRLDSKKITQPVRIVVLADLQTDQLGPYERRVFRRVMSETPDLILLAGDYLQAYHDRYEALRNQVNAYLRHIGFSAPLGVFAIQGNIDRADWSQIFADLPVTTVGRTQSFDVGELRLTCLKQRRSFSPKLRIHNDRPERFHIVTGHSPNFALGEIEADLLVAGHTHGGQVRLPWLGPILHSSKLPRTQAAGLSTRPGGAKLIVSRGIGMERYTAPRLRFLCRPELVVVDLVPQ
jgi:predicted MPP superfamily phosphohydrolase